VIIEGRPAGVRQKVEFAVDDNRVCGAALPDHLTTVKLLEIVAVPPAGTTLINPVFAALTAAWVPRFMR
jgi:hypothetical protein